MMNTKQLLAVLALPAAMAAAPAYGNLLVHYAMDEGSGSVIGNTGSVGSVNDLTIDQNVFAPGQLGNALVFAGDTTTTFAGGFTPLLGSAPRTVTLWVNSTGGAGQDSVFSFGQNGTGTKFDIDIDNATGLIEVGVGNGRTNSANVTNASATTTVTDGAWHLVTVVLPDTSPATATLPDLQFYLDGQFAYNSDGTQVVTTSPAGGIWMGRNPNQDGQQAYLGALDDVAIWDKALDADEVAAVHDGGSNGLNALDLSRAISVHDAGSGSVIVNDRQFTFGSGLGSTAGVSGADGSFVIVLDGSSQTGVTQTDSFVAGDVSDNGSVGLEDLTIIRNNYLDSVSLASGRSSGDLNSDGVVDASDYTIWRNNAPASLQSYTVPEPTSLGMLALAGLGLLSRRRRA